MKWLPARGWRTTEYNLPSLDRAERDTLPDGTVVEPCLPQFTSAFNMGRKTNQRQRLERGLLWSDPPNGRELLSSRTKRHMRCIKGKKLR